METSCVELKRTGSFNRGGIPEQEQGDFLAIEDLLDFSNKDIGSIESYESNDSTPASSILLSGDELKASAAEKSLKKQQQQQTPCLFEGDGGGSGELFVPCDDLAELEWLSNFVEESFSSADGAMLEGVLLHDDYVIRGGESKQTQRASPVSVLAHHRRGTHSTTTSSNSVGGRHSLNPDQIYASRPGRARSKRPRTAVCFWNTRILAITDDCSILEASSTCKLTRGGIQHQHSSSSDAEDTLNLGFDDLDDFFIFSTKKASSASEMPKSASNAKKGVAGAHGKSGQPAVVGDRRCVHCGSQRTPQWRAGPLGPKTLCNACGVRYKSGRLLPEYRPAASPTFVESVHSNSHRRVLEMRRQRADGLFTSGHVDQLGVC